MGLIYLKSILQLQAIGFGAIAYNYFSTVSRCSETSTGIDLEIYTESPFGYWLNYNYTIKEEKCFALSAAVSSEQILIYKDSLLLHPHWGIEPRSPTCLHNKGIILLNSPVV